MGIFLFLIGGAVIFFVLLVIWSASQAAKMSDTTAKVEQLERELDRLEHRLVFLEKRSPATPTDGVKNDQPQPIPTAEHNEPRVTPVKPASVSAPLPSIPLVRPARPIAAPATPPRSIPPFQPAQLAPINVPSTPNPLNTGVTSAPRVTPAAEARVADSVKRAVSLEERLGQNWLNKLGIVALVTGLALLLGYQLRNLGPLGKSVTGFVISIAILVTGLLLERRNRYRTFARAIIGGGWALLFFVTFALFHVPAMQVLHSQATDLVLMLTVAAAMVIHSLKYRSQVVTSLAFLLGFLTVAISHVTVFSLVAGAILATGLLAVAFQQRWFVLSLGGLIAVYLNHALWLFRLLPDGASAAHPFAQFLPSAALLLFYWLIFRIFYIVRIPENDNDRVCSTLNVLLNSAGLLTLLKYQSTHPEWAFRGLLSLGAAELILAFLARRRHHRAFVALACIASLFLLAAIPFHFAGTSWSLVWLLEAEILFVTGLALRESVFRRLGIISAFISAAHLIMVGVLPVYSLRQVAPDASHHLVTALALGCAAVAAWFNAEYATRRWSDLLGEAFDQAMLRGLSYAATLCAGLAVWLALAGPWTLLPWLAIALLLALISTPLRSYDLAQQGDLLNLAVLARVAVINFAQWDQFANSPRTLILGLTCALLYVNMWRRQPSYVLEKKNFELAYSWSAAGVLSVLAWYALQPAAVSVAWCLMGTALLEIGLAKRRAFFRHQAFLLLAASFTRIFFINIALAPVPRLYTMLPLIALFAWAYQRLYDSEQPDQLDRLVSGINAWFALGTVATLLYFSLRPSWVATAGAALAVALLLLAHTVRRPLFTAQAITLILLTGARTLGYNVLSPEPLGATFTEGRIFTAGLPCLLLFAALPIAFSLRKQQQAPDENESTGWDAILFHPVQVLFFTPLAVLFALIPAQFHGGIITIGWSVLGLLTFLFALAVGERSFRLTGLGLLLTGVGKIIAVDIWQASPTDRYITLIVMGAALLFVSYLYSRYREAILELL
jgi:uncharacterized membrane protein